MHWDSSGRWRKERASERIRFRGERRDRKSVLFSPPRFRSQPARSQGLNSHFHARSRPPLMISNSFRPGPPTDYYGSYRVEKNEIVAPPCDADNEELVLRLMGDAAKLGIKVIILQD